MNKETQRKGAPAEISGAEEFRKWLAAPATGQTLAVLHTTPRAQLAELAELVVGGMDDVTFGVDEESRITLATR